MKLILTTLAALALGLAAFTITGCNKSEPATGGNVAVKYTCSMHPEVVKDTPGTCPKCGMTLHEKH